MPCNGDCQQGRTCNCECKEALANQISDAITLSATAGQFKNRGTKMTKDEALRMAIEALETAEIQSEYDGLSNLIFKAIQACKDALAETQEPMIIKQENGMVLKLGYDELPNGTAFYTTPSREWVGLSKKEVDEVIAYPYSASRDWVKLIEAKLRAKNNG